MKFGIQFSPQDPPHGANLTRRWQEVLAAGQLAEEVGFDGLFLPEHHMMDDGYPPAPMIGLAALAAVTERVDLGTAIMLLPFYNPVQVAEHAAMVDVISGGRMILGVGIANFPPEFELFGRSKEDQVQLFEEGVELVQRLWTGEDVDFESPLNRVKGRIRPIPRNPRMWMGAMSFAGVRRAARFGCPWPADPLHNIHVIKDWVDAYRAEAERRGTTDRISLSLMRAGWVADSLDEVEEVWWPHVRSDHWFYLEHIPRWVADREPFLRDVKSETDFHFRNHMIDRMVVGDPEQCLKTILEMEDTVGNDYLIMMFRLPNGPSHAEELRCIERFGKEVIAEYRRIRG
jgi:alkanesulfonate monooxygenase SsuD/methylene tetrahydromethanopterin reductase-like flavin-dependent oxidoreductase (luciferase family)